MIEPSWQDDRRRAIDAQGFGQRDIAINRVIAGAGGVSLRRMRPSHAFRFVRRTPDGHGLGLGLRVQLLNREHEEVDRHVRQVGDVVFQLLVVRAVRITENGNFATAIATDDSYRILQGRLLKLILATWPP